MAKFRSGNLVLTSTQTIIQGSYTVLDSTRKGSFNSLDLDSTGAVITEFSIDGTLVGNSDAVLPTEKAVKTYVDTGLAGLSQNKISQLDSKVEVIDTGTGTVTIATDNVNRLVVSGAITEHSGTIVAGVGVSAGTVMIAGRYDSNPADYLFNLGTTYSFGGGVIGWGVKPQSGSSGVASSTAGNSFRSSITMGGSIEFGFAPQTTTPIGTAISMDTAVRIGQGYFQVVGTTKTASSFYAGTSDPTNSTRLNYDGYFYATRVYNAVWNDIADFQDLAEPAFYAGKCYYDTIEGAKLCSERCQKSVIGVASDTFGYGVGQDSNKTQVSIAVCGWVLANVNDATSCVPGDVLTNDADGNLVKMSDQEKSLYPERIVAIYKRKENKEFFGPNDQVVVNGRHWVKVK